MDRIDPTITFARAREITGVSAETLRRWTNNGLLPDHRSPTSGRRIYHLKDIQQITGMPIPNTTNITILYARVSSNRQKNEGDLDRQIHQLQQWAQQDNPQATTQLYTDVASGLSEKRPGLQRALKHCTNPQANQLIVTHPERLARFGVELISLLLAEHNTQLISIHKDPDIHATAESELVRDMLSVVTSFSGRLYGQRSAKSKALTRLMRAETTA